MGLFERKTLFSDTIKNNLAREFLVSAQDSYKEAKELFKEDVIKDNRNTLREFNDLFFPAIAAVGMRYYDIISRQDYASHFSDFLEKSASIRKLLLSCFYMTHGIIESEDCETDEEGKYAINRAKRVFDEYYDSLLPLLSSSKKVHKEYAHLLTGYEDTVVEYLYRKVAILFSECFITSEKPANYSSVELTDLYSEEAIQAYETGFLLPLFDIFNSFAHRICRACFNVCK